MIVEGVGGSGTLGAIAPVLGLVSAAVAAAVIIAALAVYHLVSTEVRASAGAGPAP